MIKNDVFVVGIGLGGERVGYEFQQRNYPTYLINGSGQDNKTLSEARDVLVLEGYDGLAGDRSLAFKALKNNKSILQKVIDIEEKVILLVATCDSDLNKINYNLVNMLDAFFTDDSTSNVSNFDDSEKLKMLSDHGAFVIAMRSDYKADSQVKKLSTQDMINALTARNIFLPMSNNGAVANIGIINQKENQLDEKEIVKAVGTPENIFMGYNGNVNIVCVSGLDFPTEYIANMGKKALTEQKQRLEKKKVSTLLDDLEELEVEKEVPAKKPVNKRRQVSLDLLNELE